MHTPRTMITFKSGEIRFNYRVGGILIRNEEELGLLMKIELLLYVVENFFTDPNDTWHELGLYFLMTAPADSYLNQSLETITRVDEVGNHLHFNWLPIAMLETFPLYPPFFQKALQEIPEYTVHIEEHRSRFDNK